ncbi:MAG: DUF1028 domain-containing protein [Rudaea sp.]|uniref:DUF1028 domain-containing protein n=1 Tax=unclassified Rudaea TaxID=2627037 RepID=UPI0010F7A55F|nr:MULTISPECIES: DUF1028 domain-containing protein [unclassified Rudaea]MBN8885362.1 DUF1028 domain-containing protein [Rudaea sp.]MBR0346787.1 DUF1028 domain-containing protein [Rudaea sp.]
MPSCLIGGAPTRRGFVVAGFALLAIPALVGATFSIVACDRDGNCGAAVATNNLAVGASVPYAKARVGALVSQFETNPHYGPAGLALLAAGQAPDAALKSLLDGDGDFDGTTIAERQVGIVDTKGRAAVYTGTDAAKATWAGAERGDGYAVQGNGLVGKAVLAAIKDTFLSSSGTLGERLMAALEAGQNAGGQASGKLSAALIVRTTEGDWQDIDLRVDAAAEPLRDLRQLLERHYALQAIIRAEHQAKKGAAADARASLSEALRRSYGWDRIWRRAARLAMTMGDGDRAMDCLGVFLSINPAWAKTELRDDLYRPLRERSLFQTWSR